MANRAGPSDWLSAEPTSDDGHVTYRLNVNIVAGPSAGSGVAQGSSTAGQLGDLTQGAVTTAAPTYVTGQTSPLSLTTGGALRTVTSGVDADGVAPTVNPLAMAGMYTSGTLATLTTGQLGRFNTDTYRNLRVSLCGLNATASDAFANANMAFVQNDSLGTRTLNLLATGAYTFNGGTWDRGRKPNAFKRVASSATAGNPDFAKASAGDISMFWGSCGATATFLQLYNKATAPAVGTDTPALTYPIPANAFFSETIPNGGAYFPTGIAFAFTTDAAGTTGSAAAAVTAFALLVA